MITVVVTTFPERKLMLRRALESIQEQTLAPSSIIIVNDIDMVGAAANRDRGLASVQTKWVAFLDDDDEFKPTHLQQLYDHAIATKAHLVYPWFDVVGGTDPFPQLFGQEYTPDTQTTITFLAQTKCLQEAGGFSRDWDSSVGSDPGVDPLGNRAGEEYRLVRRVFNQGCRIEHLPQRTWLWHHHGGNTMGLPSRR